MSEMKKGGKPPKQDNNTKKGATPPQTGSKISKPSGNSLKEREKKRKQVFKPVLDNGLTQANWPFIEPELSNSIIEALEIILKSSKGDIETQKGITIGFNDTTRGLEELAMDSKGNSNPIKYVFVCKNDISNTMITQHFPVLTFTASKKSGIPIKLIQLPKGSSIRVSQAVEKENTTIIGLSADFKGHEGLFSLFEQVADISVPFLEGILNSELHFNEPLINMVATSAPIMSKADNKQKGKDNKKQAK